MLFGKVLLLVILLFCLGPAVVALIQTGQVWQFALAIPATYVLIAVNRDEITGRK